MRNLGTFVGAFVVCLLGTIICITNYMVLWRADFGPIEWGILAVVPVVSAALITLRVAHNRDLPTR